LIGNSDAKYPPGHKNEILNRMQAGAVIHPSCLHSQFRGKEKIKGYFTTDSPMNRAAASIFSLISSE